MEALTTAVTTAISGLQSDILGMLGSILPYAMGILGAIVAVTFAVKFFKKISGAKG